MWISSFAIAIAVAISLSVAAFMLRTRDKMGKRIAQFPSGNTSCAPMLAELGIRKPYLLSQRMAILGLDPERLSSEDPTAFRDLEKNCNICDERRSCIRDLVRDAADPTGTNWKEYCPNVAMLGMFSALASYQQRANVATTINR